MNVGIYAIRDHQVQAYTQPFYSQTHGAAIRAFSDHVNDPNSPANKHPEDYSLHYVGDFNDESGELTPAGTITKLGSAREYIRKETTK